MIWPRYCSQRLLVGRAGCERAHGLLNRLDRELEAVEVRLVPREIGRCERAHRVAGRGEQLRRDLEQASARAVHVEQRRPRAGERVELSLESRPRARARERARNRRARPRNLRTARREPVERVGLARERRARVRACGLRGRDQPAEPGIPGIRAAAVAAEPEHRGGNEHDDRDRDRERGPRLRRLAGLQELLVGEQLEQAEARPNFAAATITPFEVVLAADHAGRRLVAELVRAEAPEAEHLIDHEPGRHVAARDDQNPCLALRGRTARPEERLQVDDGEQLATEVRDPAQPWLRAWHARDLLGQRQHLANVAARGDEALGTESESDADPLVGRGRRALARGDRGSGAALQLNQQFERPCCEGLKAAQAPCPSARSSTSCAFATSTASLTGFTR